MPPPKRGDRMCMKVRVCGSKLLTFIHSERLKYNGLLTWEVFSTVHLVFILVCTFFCSR